MEIIGVVVAVVVLVVIGAVVLSASGGGTTKSGGEPRAESAGEGHEPGAESDPTLDRPAGPAAETNMGPGPGVPHPEEQEGVDPEAAPRRPESGEDR